MMDGGKQGPILGTVNWKSTVKEVRRLHVEYEVMRKPPIGDITTGIQSWFLQVYELTPALLMFVDWLHSGSSVEPDESEGVNVL